MENSKDIHAFGCITKKETLESYEPGANFKELVLEARNPFPGYYCEGDLPVGESCKPSYVFFVIKHSVACTEDNIIRITQKIKKDYNFEFDACPGQLTLYNIVHPHIRVQSSDYKFIPELIKAFKENGVVFHKNKKVKPYISIIRIKKFFDLEFLVEGVHKCKESPLFKYIRIPKEIDWKTFETITMSIKNSFDFKNYDYALTSIYQKCGFEDYIRIFSENCDCDKLPELQQRYVEEVEKQMFI